MPKFSKDEVAEKTKGGAPTLKLKEPVPSGKDLFVFEYIVEATSDWKTVKTENGDKPVIDVTLIGSDDPDVKVGGKYSLWGSATVLHKKLTEYNFGNGSKAKIAHLGKPKGKVYNLYSVESV